MSREVMKMALEALVTAEAGLADIGDADREPTDDLAWCEARAAQALAKPRAAITAIKAALAQPEQEPMHPKIEKLYEDFFDKFFRELPPQREWVGLTDADYEEMRILQIESDVQYTRSYWVRFVEAKLKEKNT